MSIAFNEIPSDNLVPMFMAEFDNTNAAKSGAMPWKNLLIGAPLAGKTATGLRQITGDEQADALFGAGSELALMVRAFRKNTRNPELWALPVPDAEDSAKAKGKIAFSLAESTETADGESYLPASGVVRLMVGGQKVPASVTAGMTADEIATVVALAVNSNDNLPVTAKANGADVELEAKNAGTCGLGIDIRYNHNQGEELPEGLLLEISPMDGAGADRAYTDELVGNVIEGTWYNAIAIGSDDSANVEYVKALLDERWKATVQETGVLFFSPNGSKAESQKGTVSLEAASERAKKLNSQVVVIPAIPESPTPGFEIAAATLGCIAPKALNDPAAPLSNYAVAGIVAPRETERLGLEGNNALLKSGAALLVASNDGTAYLKRAVTTYKYTANGAKDTSYQQLEKIFTLSFIRWDWNSYMAGRYPHAKLADDGTDFGPGQVIMTPKLGEAELLGRYEYWISKGLVQDYATFKANLVVCRDPDDDTALQFLIPADLIDQFFIGKSKIQFK